MHTFYAVFSIFSQTTYHYYQTAYLHTCSFYIYSIWYPFDTFQVMQTKLKYLLLLSRVSRLSLFSRSLLLSFLSFLLSLLSSEVSRITGGWFLFVLNSRGESFIPGSGIGGGSGGNPWLASSMKLCGPGIPSGPIGPMPANCTSSKSCVSMRNVGCSLRESRYRGNNDWKWINDTHPWAA